MYHEEGKCSGTGSGEAKGKEIEAGIREVSRLQGARALGRRRRIMASAFLSASASKQRREAGDTPRQKLGERVRNDCSRCPEEGAE